MNENEFEKKQEAENINLNYGTKTLLNKYRRESTVGLPYSECFFDDPNQSRKNSDNESSPTPRKVTNIVKSRRNSSEQITKMQINEEKTRRRSSTTSFVNYHFLNRNDRSKINLKSDTSDYTDAEDDTRKNILSKIPIIGSRFGSRKNSNGINKDSILIIKLN